LPVYIYVSPTCGERSVSSIVVLVLLPDSCYIYLEVQRLIRYLSPNVLHCKLHFNRLKPSGSFRTTRFDIKHSAPCPHSTKWKCIRLL